MKPVILTTAFGYHPSQLDPFLRSVPQDFSGSVVIFCDPDFRVAPQSKKVCLVHTEPEVVTKRVSLNSSNNFRYFLYKEYLEKDGHSHSHILLSDSRDVLFQTDPFEFIKDDRLHVAAEPISLGACPSNAEWFQAVYGPAKLSKYSEHPVLCSGTSMGTTGSVLAYIKWMCEELSKVGPPLDGGAKSLIIDQATHIMFCARHPDRLHVETFHDGTICTLAHHSLFRLSKDGTLLNEKGKAFSIIHQYDRFRPLRSIFKDKLGIKDRFDLENTLYEYLGRSGNGKFRLLLSALFNGCRRSWSEHSR